MKHYWQFLIITILGLILSLGFGLILKAQISPVQLNQLNANPKQLPEQALNLAQAEHALEIAYRWQWQLGKLYQQQGKRKKAIASYQSALVSLSNLRHDLVTLNTEVQFDFQEQIEPVYREFADLLLEKNPDHSDLEMASNVIEALQVAELDNYFQDASNLFAAKPIDQIDRNAAVIYTIVQPKRLEVILAMNDAQSTYSGNQVFHYHTQAISQEKLETTINQLRQYITEPDRMLEVQKLAAEIYDWLIKPFTAELNQQPPKTLVFVLDNILQTIPMSVLYDGEHYLLEKYAIALTPSLRLLNSPKNSQPPVGLAGGISQPLEVDNQKFSALNSVEKELNIFTHSQNQVLLNQEFTTTNLINQLNALSPSRIHIATHAEFSSNPNQTFLLFWQQLVNLKDFNNILLNHKQALKHSIDLLVLSACGTASGDRHATLGLAGMAVRNGSATTVATLWRVNDDSTAEFMNNFYQQLATHNKAEALRLAQLQLWQVKDKDWKVPAFWSPYILIGNWQ
jgi:CHAT domain-containing protein